MEIKKTLDNMPRLLFWKIDEALILFVPFLLGVLFGSLLLIVFAFFGKWIFAKLRKQYLGINFKAFLYWHFGTIYKEIPSYLRRFKR